MKKLSLIGATLALVLAPLAISAPTYAASTCPVNFTGPNSQNICESITSYTCTVTNNTAVVLDNNNTQVATTGSATNGSTGSATNDNGTTFTTSISNNGVCSAVATTAAITPTPTPTVSAPPVAVTPPVVTKAQPRALPNTAAPSPVMVVAGTAAILALAGVAARVVVVAYGRYKL